MYYNQFTISFLNFLEIIFVNLILLKSITKYNMFSFFYFSFAYYLWIRRFNSTSKMKRICNFVIYVLFF